MGAIAPVKDKIRNQQERVAIALYAVFWGFETVESARICWDTEMYLEKEKFLKMAEAVKKVLEK